MRAARSGKPSGAGCRGPEGPQSTIMAPSEPPKLPKMISKIETLSSNIAFLIARLERSGTEGAAPFEEVQLPAEGGPQRSSAYRCCHNVHVLNARDPGDLFAIQWGFVL